MLILIQGLNINMNRNLERWSNHDSIASVDSLTVASGLHNGTHTPREYKLEVAEALNSVRVEMFLVHQQEDPLLVMQDL